MAAVVEAGQRRSLRELVVDAELLVVEQDPPAVEVHRHQRLVLPVVVVAVAVPEERPVPRVLEHERVARLARRDELGERAAELRLGGLLVQNEVDVLEAERVEVLGPEPGVGDAAVSAARRPCTR
jgi:hypothetical protein